MASAIVVKEVFGSHVITIDGYSKTKALAYGEFFSIPFMAAGHRWCIRYYPGSNDQYELDWISMYLQLDQSYNAPHVKARFTLSLLDGNGLAVPAYTYASRFTHKFFSKVVEKGFPKFIKRKVLEQSAYLKGDSFRVRCDITALKETYSGDGAAPARSVAVPPSDMHKDLGHLLLSGEGVDVTIEVDGEMFRAHRNILAARSPVFKAELFGPMKEGTSTSLTVKDIEAGVFKALLHFIYTDSFPDIDEGKTMVMAQHLLVAADRYSMERLKLMCEDKLCNYIVTSSVGTILALAELHGCVRLKKACLKFLMTGSNLKASIATDGFDHLTSSCPSVLKELLAKVTL